MWKFLGGFLVGLLSLLASGLAIYNETTEITERRVATALASELAGQGVDISTIQDAKTGEAAIRELQTLVRTIYPAGTTIEKEPPQTPNLILVGEPFDVSVNQVKRVLDAQFALTVKALKNSHVEIRMVGEEHTLALTESVPIPAPKEYCHLVFLASTIKEFSSGWSYHGTATFSIDCAAQQPD